MEATAQQELGVYISVPFCRAKCSFCNFASGVSTAKSIERYVAKLCVEIDGARSSAEHLGAVLPRRVDTLYFGGGTPSLLEPAQLRAIFAALHKNFDVQADAEITLEAAPGQIDDSLLEEALRLGVNRVSLGVQSFVDRESAAVGRTHTGNDCLREIARLSAAGIADVGADLIAGLPYQTEESWWQSLQAVKEAGLTHVSVYMLEVDEDSRLGREVMSGGLRLHAPKVPNEELVAQLYEVACDELPDAGFAQYEISNFAREGFQSKHNRKYWERAPYIGLGLDAHSMLRRDAGAVRFANADELESYLHDDAGAKITGVTLREAFEECLFLGLRLLEGVDVARLRDQYPREWVVATKETAHDLQSEGLMTLGDERWRLTQRGRLLSNDVFGHLLASVTA